MATKNLLMWGAVAAAAWFFLRPASANGGGNGSATLAGGLGSNAPMGGSSSSSSSAPETGGNFLTDLVDDVVATVSDIFTPTNAPAGPVISDNFAFTETGSGDGGIGNSGLFVGTSADEAMTGPTISPEPTSTLSSTIDSIFSRRAAAETASLKQQIATLQKDVAAKTVSFTKQLSSVTKAKPKQSFNGFKTFLDYDRELSSGGQ